MTTTPRKIIKFFLLLILSLFWTIRPSVSSADDLKYNSKYKVNALYLYNFLLFVEWPDDAISKSVKVAIYGDPKLYEAFESLSGEKIRGEKLAVFLLKKPEALDDSFQVLFVGDDDTHAVRELLKRVSGKPILTVSDRKNFVALGGMVLFKDPEALRMGGKNNKRFLINLSIVRKSRLKIRARLLRISDIVYDLDPASLETGD